MTYLKLGEILINKGLITQEHLRQALELQGKEKKRIGEILINLGVVTEDNVAKSLSEQLGIPYYSSENPELLEPRQGQDLERLIPDDFAVKNLVLPLSHHKNSLTCAVFDPLDFSLLNELRKLTNCDINIVISTKNAIHRAINDFYGLNDFDSQVHPPTETSEKEIAPKEPSSNKQNESINEQQEEDKSIIKIVDLIISQAINERATDIHLEPFENEIHLRYRIDGKLYDIPPPERHLYLPIISRIKILSKLNVSEKRFPQEGIISKKISEHPLEIRVSSIPTIWGEKIVMRILDKNSVPFELEKLGFNKKQVHSIRKFFTNPYGLFIVTGPIGSGTSTTLYSLLNELKDPTKNIMTIEDPVEFTFEGVNQIVVNAHIGLDFPKILRSSLKQDPDIILVSQIKNAPTASLCIEAAMAGKFVIGALMTNDTSSAFRRFNEFGIPNYLITATPMMFVAQRLARRLCEKCKQSYEPNLELTDECDFKNKKIFRAKGCDECNGTGYKGRIVIAEILTIDHEIRTLIAEGATQSKIQDIARKKGMSLMFESGLRLVDEGVTSFDEICRVTASIS